MEWYKFDILAFERATQDLTPTECGIYLRLLNDYYLRQGPQSSENGSRRLKLVTGCVSKRDMEALKTVLARYFPCSEDGLRHNPRADQELQEYQGRVDAARIAARTRHAPHSAMPIHTYKQTYNEDACAFTLPNGKKCGKPNTGRYLNQFHCGEHDPTKKA